MILSNMKDGMLALMQDYKQAKAASNRDKVFNTTMTNAHGLNTYLAKINKVAEMIIKIHKKKKELTKTIS